MRYVVATVLVLAGCAAPDLPPEISNSPASNAQFLDFLTADELAAITADLPQEVALPASPLAGRLAGLRARAAALRGPIFTSGDRTNLIGEPG